MVLAVAQAPIPADVAACWLAQLPAARQARLATWSDGVERDRSLVATRLLRVALARNGLDPDAIGAMTWSADGRPSLPLPVHFSFAHCEGLTVCTLSRTGPVGIDVEALGPVTAAEVAKYLSPAERDWAGSDPGRFYAVWTRKEAVVKAAGTRGLRDLQAVRTEGDRAFYEGSTWHTAPVDVGPGYVAHLAAATPLDRPAAERLDAAALM